MQINEITTIITVISILIMTSGTGISSSLVFAQNDPEIDFDNLTLTNSSGVPVDTTLTNEVPVDTTLTNEVPVDTTLTNGSGVQGDTSGVELPPQQPQGPLSPSTPSQQQPQGLLSPPLFNRVQSEINRSEQCTAMVQSLIQRAQDAIDNGEYGQWRSGVFNEIQQLNMDCPEQMQGQQQPQTRTQQ